MDSRLIGVTGERNLPQLSRLRGLTWTTLPFYYVRFERELEPHTSGAAPDLLLPRLGSSVTAQEVISTIKKGTIVMVCGFMGGPDSGILLQVLLGVVLIIFQELLLATRVLAVQTLLQPAHAVPLSLVAFPGRRTLW